MREADESAYCDFVAARRRSLLQTAFLFTGDWHQAEDLVQITLAKLYVAWTRIRRRDDVDAYARRTLLNAYLDERRRPWRREQAAETVPDRATTAAAEPPDPYVKRQILTALAQIPARQRAALVLRFWADLSVDQVADLLNCSAGTVKSQTARGLEHLREMLGPTLLDELKEYR
jgi:RNA polymerase sigma-70 factor (sigma-E family)